MYCIVFHSRTPLVFSILGGDWLEAACADRHVDCAGLKQAKGCAYDLTAHGYVNDSVATVCPRSCDSCPTLAPRMLNTGGP